MAKPTKYYADTTVDVQEQFKLTFTPYTDKYVISIPSIGTYEGSIETLVDTPGVSLNMVQFDTLVYYAALSHPDIDAGDIGED